METYCINNTIKKRFNLMRKLILISYLTMILIIVFSSAYGQSNKISMELKDVEIETVLEELRSKTDISIIYNHEQLVDLPKISISVEQKTVEEILEEALKGTGVTFEKINNIIVIKPRNESLQIGPDSEKEYSQTIRGKVLDRDTKFPLPFATVQILNSSPIIGTTSNIDGEYVIENVPVGRYSLKFSFVGYEMSLCRMFCWAPQRNWWSMQNFPSRCSHWVNW